MGFIVNRIKSYALNRLKEASTWKAIASFIVSMIGYHLSNGQLELAGSAGAGVYAFLSAVMPDKLEQTPASTTPQPAPASTAQTAAPSTESNPGSPTGGPFGTQ